MATSRRLIASIDTIAAEAGVSRQTVYNQIGDKEKVFAAVGIKTIGTMRKYLWPNGVRGLVGLALHAANGLL